MAAVGAGAAGPPGPVSAPRGAGFGWGRLCIYLFIYILINVVIPVGNEGRPAHHERSYPPIHPQPPPHKLIQPAAAWAWAGQRTWRGASGGTAGGPASAASDCATTCSTRRCVKHCLPSVCAALLLGHTHINIARSAYRLCSSVVDTCTYTLLVLPAFSATLLLRHAHIHCSFCPPSLQLCC